MFFNKDKSKFLIIADCLEDDYKLYKKVYKKLAKLNHIPYENVFVITDETVKQLSMSSAGRSIDTAKKTGVLNFITFGSANVNIMCNILRCQELRELLPDARNVRYYGYYTSILGVKEHPIMGELASAVIDNNGFGCTTTLVPNNKYLFELHQILNYKPIKKRKE